MRIIGVRFQDRSSALHALEHVRSRFGNERLAVAPLADGEASATLVAGPLEDDSREEASALLVRHGGEIVSDIDERVAGWSG